jgi:hypothetical protein
MIVHPARHLFEAKFPTLEDHEKEIFYQHPEHDIKCNQLGIIYCDDAVYSIYDRRGTSMVRFLKTGLSFGSKTKIIWECYTGQSAFAPHFFFANGNPLDTRRENLVLCGPLSDKDRQPYIRIKREFIKASVEHLIGLEQRMEAVGIDQTQLHELLLLPQWLIGARERFTPPPPPQPKKTYTKGTPKRRTTEAEVEEVIRLYNQGQTFYAIIDRMGWTSTSRIKKIAKDYGLTR